MPSPELTLEYAFAFSFASRCFKLSVIPGPKLISAFHTREFLEQSLHNAKRGLPFCADSSMYPKRS